MNLRKEIFSFENRSKALKLYTRDKAYCSSKTKETITVMFRNQSYWLFGWAGKTCQWDERVNYHPVAIRFSALLIRASQTLDKYGRRSSRFDYTVLAVRDMKISHVKVLITFLYHIDTTFPETIKIIRPLDRKKWKYGIDSFHIPQSVCNLENSGNRGYCKTTSCSIDETGNYSSYLCSCSKENSTVTYFKDRWRCMENKEVRKQLGRYFIFICKITDQWESSSDGHKLVMNRIITDSESLAYVLCEILISKGVYICFPTRSIHNIISKYIL